jgi:hypothetical protein
LLQIASAMSLTLEPRKSPRARQSAAAWSDCSRGEARGAREGPRRPIFGAGGARKASLVVAQAQRR